MNSQKRMTKKAIQKQRNFVFWTIELLNKNTI